MQPCGHKPRLAAHDLAQQFEKGVFGFGQLRIVAAHGVFGQGAQVVGPTARGEVFEGAHADVAARHAGQDGSGQGCFAEDRFAGGRHGKAARGRDAQAVHGFADDVFAQHGTQGGASVATAGKRGLSGTLELDVEAFAPGRDVLAQENGPSVAEHGEMPELVPGIGLGNGIGAGRQTVAGEDGGPLRTVQTLRVQAEGAGQFVVEKRDGRGFHRHGFLADIERIRQADVGVVEIPARAGEGVVVLGRHDAPMGCGFGAAFLRINTVFRRGSQWRWISPQDGASGRAKRKRRRARRIEETTRGRLEAAAPVRPQSKQNSRVNFPALQEKGMAMAWAEAR